MKYIKIILLFLSGMNIYAENILEFSYYAKDFSIKLNIDTSGEIITEKIFFENNSWHVEKKRKKFLDFELLVIQRDINEISNGILELKEITGNFVDYIEELKVINKNQFIVKFVHFINNSQSGVIALNNSTASDRLLDWVYKQMQQEKDAARK